MSSYQVVVGRFEYLDVVDVLQSVPAKVDTGAFRSSIHASNIKEISKNGVNVLRFKLLGHPAYPDKSIIEVSDYSIHEVISSNGHISKRFGVKLKVKLGFKVFYTTFTLADRSKNVFPVLIGREALRKRFVVDPEKAGVKRSEIKIALNKLKSNEELEGVNV